MQADCFFFSYCTWLFISFTCDSPSGVKRCDIAKRQIKPMKASAKGRWSHICFLDSWSNLKEVNYGHRIQRHLSWGKNWNWPLSGEKVPFAFTYKCSLLRLVSGHSCMEIVRQTARERKKPNLHPVRRLQTRDASWERSSFQTWVFLKRRRRSNMAGWASWRS